MTILKIIAVIIGLALLAGLICFFAAIIAALLAIQCEQCPDKAECEACMEDGKIPPCRRFYNDHNNLPPFAS